MVNPCKAESEHTGGDVELRTNAVDINVKLGMCEAQMYHSHGLLEGTL